MVLKLDSNTESKGKCLAHRTLAIIFLVLIGYSNCFAASISNKDSIEPNTENFQRATSIELHSKVGTYRSLELGTELKYGLDDKVQFQATYDRATSNITDSTQALFGANILVSPLIHPEMNLLYQRGTDTDPEWGLGLGWTLAISELWDADLETSVEIQYNRYYFSVDTVQTKRRTHKVWSVSSDEFFLQLNQDITDSLTVFANALRSWSLDRTLTVTTVRSTKETNFAFGFDFEWCDSLSSEATWTHHTFDNALTAQEYGLSLNYNFMTNFDISPSASRLIYNANQPSENYVGLSLKYSFK